MYTLKLLLEILGQIFFLAVSGVVCICEDYSLLFACG